MDRNEMAKVLRDEIERTREQLVCLEMVLARRAEERRSRMGWCEECERLRQAYETATIESVQLYKKDIESMTEDQDQGLQKLSEMTTKAEAAEQLRVEARQRLARHQAATGHR